MKPVGQIQYFRSKVDRKLHPCAVCATDDGGDPKPLILEVSPGAITNLPGAVSQVEEIAGIAARHGHGCVALRPTGRGPGSVYQHYGEVDVLEAIEHAAAHYAIDRDRITITGSSMGGAAVWYLISHYPDLFAGAAPFCGYCDYRLWEKPGGLTYPMHPWEEPSWRSRSAAFLVENLRHTPVWMIHGEWDRAVGGGVPVEHSRQMARRMAERGFAHRYTEVPRTGHGCRKPETWEKVILWLIDQRKPSDPDRVSLAAYDLRHNRSYWVAIDQLARYGDRGSVDAELLPERRAAVRTEGVRTLSLGPIPGREPLAVTLDGQELPWIDPGRQQVFHREPAGTWKPGAPGARGQKWHAASGPIGDLFHEGTILVPGTAGTEEEAFFASWVAGHAAGYYRARNGGVHRGGIPGENTVDLPVVPDRELTEESASEYNLLLYGTHTSNSVMARFRADLPLEFDEGTIRVADRTYPAGQAAIFAVFPHPRNPERYVAVHGGITPDALCWGSHLDMNLLPDYLVYSGGEVLDWGFWGNDWRSQAPV